MDKNRIIPNLEDRSIDTPVIDLKWLANGGLRLLAKCEFLGPTGSHKDRMYRHMVRQLEATHRIRPGMRLIDFSSGNAGAALAYIGACKGYEVTIIRPQGLSQIKALQILSLGAQLILTPQEEGVIGAEIEARRLAEEVGEAGFLMRQTEAITNIEAFSICGREIVASMREEGIRADCFVCCIGTGGTLSGIATELKGAFPKCLITGGEVQGSDLNLAAREGRTVIPCPHHLEGVSPGQAYPATNLEMVDRIETCTEVDAWRQVFELEKHGILVGPSSGMNLAIALRLAPAMPEGSTVVTVFFDAAWKYYPERSRWLAELGLS